MYFSFDFCMNNEPFSFANMKKTLSTQETDFKTITDNCAICLEELIGNPFDHFTHLNGCQKIFHIECINEWKKKSNECPLCRQLLEVIEVAHDNNDNNYLDNDIGDFGDYIGDNISDEELEQEPEPSVDRLMQLVSSGMMDLHLTGNVTTTPYKITYVQHTNFATEPIESRKSPKKCTLTRQPSIRRKGSPAKYTRNMLRRKNSHKK